MNAFDEMKGMEKDKDNRSDSNPELTKLTLLADCYIRDNGHYLGTRSISDLRTQLSKINYNQNDIQTVISFYYDNLEKSRVHRNIGYVGGVMLNVLAEKNKKDGKKEFFEFNAEGHFVGSAFYGATNIDNLIVKNYKSANICSALGESFETPSRLANGKFNTLAFISNDSIDIASLSGYSLDKTTTEIDNFIAYNNKCKNLLNFGQCKIKLLIVYNNTIKNFCSELRDGASIENLVIVDNNISLKNAFTNLSWNNSQNIVSNIITEGNTFTDLTYTPINLRLKFGDKKTRKRFSEKVVSIVRSIDYNSPEHMNESIKKINELIESGKGR